LQSRTSRSTARSTCEAQQSALTGAADALTGCPRSWAATSLLLVAGLFGLGVLVAREALSRVADLVFRVIIQQALFRCGSPRWRAGGARVAPGVERSWTRLASVWPGRGAVVPAVGEYCSSAADQRARLLATWLLCQAGSAAALAIAPRVPRAAPPSRVAAREAGKPS
jgi:hypothetical protein